MDSLLNMVDKWITEEHIPMDVCMRFRPSFDLLFISLDHPELMELHKRELLERMQLGMCLSPGTIAEKIAKTLMSISAATSDKNVPSYMVKFLGKLQKEAEKYNVQVDVHFSSVDDADLPSELYSVLMIAVELGTAGRRPCTCSKKENTNE